MVRTFCQGLLCWHMLALTFHLACWPEPLGITAALRLVPVVTPRIESNFQSLITAFFPVVPRSPQQPPEDPSTILVRRASHRAVAHFWSHLLDFVSLASVPEGWSALPTSHPFMGVRRAVERSSLQLNLPPGIVWEANN